MMKLSQFVEKKMCENTMKIKQLNGKTFEKIFTFEELYTQLIEMKWNKLKKNKKEDKEKKETQWMNEKWEKKCWRNKGDRRKKN